MVKLIKIILFFAFVLGFSASATDNKEKVNEEATAQTPATKKKVAKKKKKVGTKKKTTANKGATGPDQPKAQRVAKKKTGTNQENPPASKKTTGSETTVPASKQPENPPATTNENRAETGAASSQSQEPKSEVGSENVPPKTPMETPDPAKAEVLPKSPNSESEKQTHPLKTWAWNLQNHIPEVRSASRQLLEQKIKDTKEELKYKAWHGIEAYKRKAKELDWTADVQKGLLEAVLASDMTTSSRERQTARNILTYLSQQGMLDESVQISLLKRLNFSSAENTKAAINILARLPQLAPLAEQRAIEELFKSSNDVLAMSAFRKVFVSHPFSRRIQLSEKAQVALISTPFPVESNKNDLDLSLTIADILRYQAKLYPEALNELSRGLISRTPAGGQPWIKRGDVVNILLKHWNSMDNIVDTVLVGGLLDPKVDSATKETVAKILKKKAEFLDGSAMITLAQAFRKEPSLMLGEIFAKSFYLDQEVQNELLLSLKDIQDPKLKRIVTVALAPEGFVKTCRQVFGI